MKLLKIFGIVAGIHVAALILIFANPGCSTTSKRPAASETASLPDEPVVSVPNLSSDYSNDAASTQMNAYSSSSPVTPAPLLFNPDAPATATDSGRYSPTRPNTPVAGALKSEPVADVMPVTTYTVVRGDSLWSIAKRNGLTVSDLASANSLRASATLQLGQKLIIPGQAVTTTTAPAMPATAPAEKKVETTTTKKESVMHTVKSGETLGAIARKYQVSVGEIATANNISDPGKIRPGQELMIPGWTAPTPKPATKPAQTVTQPVENKPAPVINTQDEPVDNPVIFTPPPIDQPLDEGFINNTNDAPVIQVEESP